MEPTNAFGIPVYFWFLILIYIYPNRKIISDTIRGISEFIGHLYMLKLLFAMANIYYVFLSSA